MPDLTGFPALDVAIGLAFLFFLLSTVASAISEAIAAFLGWRAKTLEDAAASLLGDPNVKRKFREWFGLKRKTPTAEDGTPDNPLDQFTHSVFEHWTVKALVRDPTSPWRRRSRPSYIPPDVFSLAVSETLAHRLLKAPDQCEVQKSARDAATTPWGAADADLYAAILALVGELPMAARPFLKSAASNAEATLEGFRTEVETAFDDTMSRASGWYKRKAQTMILVIAIVITVALNVDTVKVGTRLWNDEALRNGVTAAAIKAVNEAPGGPTGATGASGAQSGSGAVPKKAKSISNVPPLGSSGPAGLTQATTGSAGATGATGATGAMGATGAAACAASTNDPSVPANAQGCITYQADRAGKALSDVDTLKLPIGWHDGNEPDFGGNPSWLAGWLLTVLAVSLGAPFWFDLLNKLVRLRGTGVPQTPDTSGSVGQSAPASGKQDAPPVPKRALHRKRLTDTRTQLLGERRPPGSEEIPE